MGLGIRTGGSSAALKNLIYGWQQCFLNSTQKMCSRIINLYTLLPKPNVETKY